MGDERVRHMTEMIDFIVVSTSKNTGVLIASQLLIYQLNCEPACSVFKL